MCSLGPFGGILGAYLEHIVGLAPTKGLFDMSKSKRVGSRHAPSAFLHSAVWKGFGDCVKHGYFGPKLGRPRTKPPQGEVGAQTLIFRGTCQCNRWPESSPKCWGRAGSSGEMRSLCPELPKILHGGRTVRILPLAPPVLSVFSAAD